MFLLCYYLHTQSFTYSSLQSEPTSDYTLTLEPANVSLTTGQRYWSSESESTGDNDSLQFFVIEELSGEVVLCSIFSKISNVALINIILPHSL